LHLLEIFFKFSFFFCENTDFPNFVYADLDALLLERLLLVTLAVFFTPVMMQNHGNKKVNLLEQLTERSNVQVMPGKRLQI